MGKGVELITKEDNGEDWINLIHNLIHTKWLRGLNMDEASVRYTNAALIDDKQRTHLGDFLLHADGTWSESNGDEDVIHNLDGSKKLITRSFQNWHTHLPMQLNARDFSDGLPLEEWLQKSIFPTEMNLTKEYAKSVPLLPL